MKTIKVFISVSTSNFMTISSELIKAGYDFNVYNHNDGGCINFEFITTDYDSENELKKDLIDLGKECEMQYMYHLEVVNNESKS